MLKAVLAVVVSAGLVGNAAATMAVPDCGGTLQPDDRTRISLYMGENGAYSYGITFDIPPNDIKSSLRQDRLDEAAISFAYEPEYSNIPQVTGDHTAEMNLYNVIDRVYLGESEYPYWAGSITLTCGRKLTMENHSVSKFPNLFVPFIALRKQIPACVEAIRRSGHYRIRLSKTPGSVPAVVLEGRVPLDAMLRKVQRYRGRELRRAAAGECRLTPPPMPVQ